MKDNILKIALLTISTGFALTGCQTTAETNPANSQRASQATESTSRSANNPATNQIVNEANKVTETDISQKAADTPTAVYKAAYVARKNKNIKVLKQLLSQDMLEFFTLMGEGKPDPLDEGLKQLVESPQGTSDETRNEKIKGDKATLEYLDKNGAWKTMDLIKEEGAWKLTINKAEK